MDKFKDKLEKGALFIGHDVKTEKLVGFLKEQFPEFPEDTFREEISRVVTESGFSSFLIEYLYWTITSVSEDNVEVIVGRRQLASRNPKNRITFLIACSEEGINQRIAKKESERKTKLESQEECEGEWKIAQQKREERDAKRRAWKEKKEEKKNIIKAIRKSHNKKVKELTRDFLMQKERIVSEDDELKNDEGKDYEAWSTNVDDKYK